MRTALRVTALALSLAASAPAGQSPLGESAKLFDYDAKQPLEAKESARYDRPGCTVIDLTYASPKGGRVPAYLVVPKTAGPFAAILFGHWGGGNRAEFLPEAELYALVGVVSLLPDYPWDRPEPWRQAPDFSLAHPGKDKEVYAQAVVDMRRGLDLLLARADVDPKRVAYVGHSYGAQWGAILSAIDRRLKGAVLVGGTPAMQDVLESNDPGMVEFRKDLPPGRLERYIEVNRPLDAIHFVPFAKPAPLLFQFATFEQNFSRAAMDRYFQAASDPKTVLWYDTAHDLNDPAAVADRARWLERHAGIPSFLLVLERRLAAKPQ